MKNGCLLPGTEWRAQTEMGTATKCLLVHVPSSPFLLQTHTELWLDKLSPHAWLRCHFSINSSVVPHRFCYILIRFSCRKLLVTAASVLYGGREYLFRVVGAGSLVWRWFNVFILHLIGNIHLRFWELEIFTVIVLFTDLF